MSDDNNLVTTPLPALREELHTIVNTAKANEVRILLFLARRYVTLGQREYGPVVLFDGRNNTLERMMELADEQFYGAKDALEHVVTRQRWARRRRTAAKWRRG